MCRSRCSLLTDLARVFMLRFGLQLFELHPSLSPSSRIRDAAVITWDEAPMTNKAVLSSMEEVCRLAMHSSQPFGGKIMILLGDF